MRMYKCNDTWLNAMEEGGRTRKIFHVHLSENVALVEAKAKTFTYHDIIPIDRFPRFRRVALLKSHHFYTLG